MVSEKLVTDVNRILWVDVTTDQNEVIRFSAHAPWDDGKRPLEGQILDLLYIHPHHLTQCYQIWHEEPSM